ncbi:16S rRNA (cytosine(967)-C(5))-methyltransferase [Desulfonema ishimotonii]|uniref:16S rRNA (cytosine(967)-C(5))-methyltransferase n=1 Tax=Desulfonema ishimotonii TaxID=45657 RepID=A0A401FU53_9BACT|nr:16S rRNA (cytosine(967)-C(5))-methyltransferase RsmB [Desulfonema ishimotonii]GBC60499.1 16S rRNA (cytosine(967)-C(5))-methyltransferase [Desulfonema ishimotonii]
MTHDARQAALSVLNELDQRQQTLDSILEKMPALPPRDQRLFHALTYGVLRWQGRLDHIIGHFSRTGLSKISPPVLNILRLGLFQMIYLDRVPVSAAINTAVELARKSGAAWATGFVNGLLRNADRHLGQVSFPDPDKDPVLSLATAQSFPRWLVKRWIGRLGYGETEKLCRIINTIPPLTVRTNTLKVSRETLMASLDQAVQEIQPTRFSPEGLSFSSPAGAIPELDAFQKGWFQVQDEAAQMVAHMLDPRPGQRVLDACAGLGGKTGHIAQIMENRGEILATDHVAHKLSRMADEMARLGITIVKPHVHDLHRPLNENTVGTFDRILLDAPCSGLGVLRRNPDAKWSADKKNLQKYQARQVRFLSHLAPLLAPGGLLVYAVCTTEPEENGMVVRAFTDRHPDMAVETNPAGLPDAARPLLTGKGYLKTLPHTSGMDGFFSVCFRRKI